ncbi:hypothetical protein [Streptomyces chiangmaiensis]|uniref:Uncharacterized protein n=1 Tax=Streptomyces chiangmaiensis TaxID=766497 RepID=A0ABU7FVP9_9ACTN|nr:hypothetical protein [Streptomyces chiangmaiensis]MED7828162.1 hypothetical protein [Streptomyces chiangmaiensis]
MTTSSWDRFRRVAAAASVFTVIALVAAAVVLALGVGVPEGWWPHTGRAFAADTRSVEGDPCGLIVGPAKAYCERDATSSASTGQHNVPSGAWRLVPAGAGVGGLMVWRLRSATGQRRH